MPPSERSARSRSVRLLRFAFPLALLLALAACTTPGGLHLTTVELLTLTPDRGPSGGGVSVTLAGSWFVQPLDANSGALSVLQTLPEPTLTLI